MRALAVLLAVSVPVALLGADGADACGGLFCASTSPSPVDQQAERVLFEVNDDLSVTATVEVQYGGDPSAFSWIIPVSAVPSFVETGSAAVFQLLDAATRPTVVAPQRDFSACDQPMAIPLGGGMSCAEAIALPPVEPALLATDDSGVSVVEYPNVGPYTDIILVEGQDPNQVITFLNDNGYLVTEAMRPIFEEYSSESQRFLAVQLQPDAAVKDIVPIRFHCPAPGPVIPLRLTQVAALPEMGILVLIAGAQRYRPEMGSGFSELLVPPDDVHFDNAGRSNYFPLVSKMIDDLGGLGFVTERAQPTAAIQPLVDQVFLGTEDEQAGRLEVGRLFAARPYLTRLYSRLSGHEMLLDPVFGPSDGGDVDGTLDLSEQTIEMCSAIGAAPPCGLLYCGDVDACATTDTGGDGCVCTASRTARAATAPDGTPTVSCVPTDYDFIGGAGMRGCDGVDCGDGLCFPQNGTATCRCAAGAAAVVDGGIAGVRCVPAVMSYSSDQLTWPAPPAVPATSQSCSGGRGTRVGGGLSLVLLFGASLAVRLRRRPPD